MPAQGSRRLQPIAVLCAVVLLVWGLFAVASVVALIQIHQKFGWASFGDWNWWVNALAIGAAAIAMLAVVCGVLGLRWRPALHVGGVIALLSVAATIAGLVITHAYLARYGFTWEQIAENYRDGLRWQQPPDSAGLHTWWYFVNDILLPLGVVVLLLWAVVLITGAGRRVDASNTSAATGYAYGVAPQQDYRYVVPGTPVTVAQPPAEPVTEPTAEAEPAAAPEPVDEPAAEPAPELAVEPATVEPATAQPEQPEQLEPAAEQPGIPAAEPQPGDDEPVWFVTIQGTDHGPYTRTQLRGYADEGRLHAGTLTHLAGEDTRDLADVLA